MSDYLKLIGQLRFIRDYECKTRAEVKTVNDVITILSTSAEKTQLSGEDATFDCISRQAAIDAVNDVIADYIPNIYGRYEALPLEMASAINRLPSAQPEIVRCKDCKHQEKFWHGDKRRKDGGYYIYGCELAEDYSHVCLDDDYCSYAERIE